MWSGVSVITGPASSAVTVADCKARTRIDTTDDDADLQTMIDSSVSRIEGPRGAGIALMAQTWRQSLKRLYGDITLLGWPIKSVTHIKYLDVDETEQTLDTSVYRVCLDETPAKIVLRKGKSWPVTLNESGAVWIDYVLGEADAANIEPALIDVVLLLVSHRYEHRDLIADGVMVEIPYAVESVMQEYRQSWAGG